MFKTITIMALVIVAAILLFAATRADDFRVERSMVVRATPEAVFPLVNDLKNFSRWSPYEKMDPQMQRTYSTPSAGKGASYEWSGNKNVGHGRMQITDAPPPARVQMQIDFYSPFEAHNTAEFVIEPQGTDSARVTWAMFGPANFMSKLMSVFMSMDKMVGSQFEDGLANLKTLAESTPVPAPAAAAPASLPTPDSAPAPATGTQP